MFISVDRAKEILKKDRQCIFRVIYNPNKNTMLAQIDVSSLYEIKLPTKEYDMCCNHIVLLKLLKKFISEVIFDFKDDFEDNNEKEQTTRELVQILEDNHFNCTEINDKYEYILIISLR